MLRPGGGVEINNGKDLLRFSVGDRVYYRLVGKATIIGTGRDEIGRHVFRVKLDKDDDPDYVTVWFADDSNISRARD